MTYQIITDYQIEKRNYWIQEINRLSGNFGVDSAKVEAELKEEIESDGIESIVGHLRLCGAIPESYGHDTSEEKLYSKYTDVVIHEAFSAIGLQSKVIKKRANTADVECVAADYSFVADAKAFRLSRTAKNQKDFKVQAMDNWKHGRPYAMVVCPVYQLPCKKSQIYEQAASRCVCLGTYSHLAVLVRYAQATCPGNAEELLHRIFISVKNMTPAEEAHAYWRTLNKTVTEYDPTISDIWREEVIASAESVEISRKEALSYFNSEEGRFMRLSKEDAIAEILKSSNLDGKRKTAQGVKDNRLLSVI